MDDLRSLFLVLYTPTLVTLVRHTEEDRFEVFVAHRPRMVI